MEALASEPKIHRVISVKIRSERDIVAARRRARQMAGLLGFSSSDQVALATAVSEITRNALQYAGGGSADFGVGLISRPEFLWVEISDHGPGIAHLEKVLSGQYSSKTGLGIGLTGARRLTERFEIASSPAGTRVRFGKTLPAGARPVDLARLGRELAAEPETPWLEELQQQNQDLMRVLESLRMRESQLDARQTELRRMSLELEETNRGVVALYAELE